MDRTEQLTSESIRELLATEGPCVTIVLNGNNAGAEIELKNAIDRLGSQFAPVAEAVRDARKEANAKVSIAILSAPAFTRVYRVSGAVRPLARVGERFDIRTLLSIRNGQKNFYLLALSQNRTRLLHCTESSSEEVEMPGAPTGLADDRQTRQPDHVLDNRSSGGPDIGGGSVMFGTSTDREDKDRYLLHFFADLDRGVNEALRQSEDPLILVGVEHEIALYNRVNTYPHLIEPGVHGAPDGLEGGEMHRRALELLENRGAERGAEVPADFDKRVGTGHASIHVQEIVEAAWEGRVSHLFLQENASYLGAYDPVRRRVKHTEDPLDSPVDLIDAAAEQTIRHGGEAKILAATAMPNGVPVCALMRYPAVQNPLPAGITEAA